MIIYSKSPIFSDRICFYGIWLRFIMLYVLFLFSFFSRISIEPPECAGVVCDLKCPSDSKVLQIYGYDPNNLVVTHPSEAPISEEIITSKRKRAIKTRKRESIKIVPGHYIRHRREINDSLAAIQKMCCECKCDFTICPDHKDHKCPPNEYKITISQGTQTPGNCCPKFSCSTQKPTCYSHNLKQQFNPMDHWKDDACTHCECSETGETNCETPICKPLSCEKKHTIDGECCPVCDISDSKFCEPDCDIHCRNGFEHDTERNCAICACAKTTPTTKKTTIFVESGMKFGRFALYSVHWSIQSQINWHLLNTNRYWHFFLVPDGVANSTFDVITTVEPSTWNPELNTVNGMSTDFIDNTNASSTKPISNDDSWYVHLPIVLGICITIGAFAVILSLTCRHLSHKKDKQHLNRKQNTPLIL